MAMGRPKAELVLTQTEQAQPQSIARSRSLPCRVDQQEPAHQTGQRRDALERALDCGRDGYLWH